MDLIKAEHWFSFIDLRYTHQHNKSRLSTHGKDILKLDLNMNIFFFFEKTVHFQLSNVYLTLNTFP